MIQASSTSSPKRSPIYCVAWRRLCDDRGAMGEATNPWADSRKPGRRAKPYRTCRLTPIQPARDRSPAMCDTAVQRLPEPRENRR